MQPSDDFDVVVYGATPSGIIAATQMGRKGLSVALLAVNGRIGGLMTSGLCALDLVNPAILKGIPQEFFYRAGAHYNKGVEYRPESHVAEQIFNKMLVSANVNIICNEPITGVAREGNSLSTCRLRSGRLLRASYWIDATYEGDLMPFAGVSFSIGREGTQTYREKRAGQTRLSPMFSMPNMPEISGLDANGHLLPYLERDEHYTYGAGDKRIQAFCFRLTLTNKLENRLPIPEPSSYDPKEMELFRRITLAARSRGAGKVEIKHKTTFNSIFFNLAALPNGKYDMNSGHATPINLPRHTEEWISGSIEDRKCIYNRYIEYTAKILHFIRTDEAIPEETQRFFREFGFCADEYRGTGGWPPEVYVREGRRLKGKVRLLQKNIVEGLIDEDTEIGQARYPLDCKPVRWLCDENGHARREGMMFQDHLPRYSLPYGMILPKEGECSNLLVPVAASASHVGFSSFRMEPHWMITGAAAGAAIVLSKEHGIPIHQLSPRDVKALSQSEVQTSC